jgi:hypothetical protein
LLILDEISIIPIDPRDRQFRVAWCRRSQAVSNGVQR